MTTYAIGVLQRELSDAETVLKDIRAEHKNTIDAGRRAQSAVDAQSRQVHELQQAIESLMEGDRGHEEASRVTE